MTKSLELYFLGLYSAILRDYTRLFPSHVGDTSKDYSKLKSHLESMGVPVILEHLPAIRKHLDQCLDSGLASVSGLPLSRGNSKTPHIPRLFGGIWSEIFDPVSGYLKDDIDPEHVRFLRMLLSVSKRAKVEPPKKRLYAAIQEFYDVDETLPHPSPFWGGVSGAHRSCIGSGYTRRPLDDEGPRQYLLFGEGEEAFQPDLIFPGKQVPARIRDGIQRVADQVSFVIGDFVANDWSFKHGPGAVANRRWDEYKYSFHGWSDVLDTVFPYSEFGRSARLVRDDCHDTLRTVDYHLPAAKLSAVPKDFKGPRLIASEPVENQWCQQSIKEFLYHRVQHTFLGNSIDFHDQSKSQVAAIRASLVGDMCTMDLSAASDRISCDLVEALFRANTPLLNAFRAVRTQFLTTNEDSKAPRVHRLRKFSTMGSALTFPVQSLVFYCIVVGVGLSLSNAATSQRSIRRLGRLVRIFGDDLIFPVDWEPHVRNALVAFGLKVNTSKTFIGNNFRESCGADGFRGADVTPTYIGLPCVTTQPETVESHVEVLKNLYSTVFPNTFAYFESTIPEQVRKLLPMVSRQSPVLGILSPFGFELHPNSKVRYNRSLQRREFLALVLKDRGRKRIHEGFSNLLEFFTRAASDPDRYASCRTITTGEVTDRGRKHKLALRWAPL